MAILALVVQVLLDSANLPLGVKWIPRVTAPLSPILLSAGFFGIAHFSSLGVLLWAGASCVVLTVLISGIGLLRRPAAQQFPSAPRA